MSFCGDMVSLPLSRSTPALSFSFFIDLFALLLYFLSSQTFHPTFFSSPVVYIHNNKNFKYNIKYLTWMNIQRLPYLPVRGEKAENPAQTFTLFYIWLKTCEIQKYNFVQRTSKAMLNCTDDSCILRNRSLAEKA